MREIFFPWFRKGHTSLDPPFFHLQSSSGRGWHMTDTFVRILVMDTRPFVRPRQLQWGSVLCLTMDLLVTTYVEVQPSQDIGTMLWQFRASVIDAGPELPQRWPGIAHSRWPVTFLLRLSPWTLVQAVCSESSQHTYQYSTVATPLFDMPIFTKSMGQRLKTCFFFILTHFYCRIFYVSIACLWSVLKARESNFPGHFNFLPIYLLVV